MFSKEEVAHMEIARRVLEDRREIGVVITVGDAWLLVSGLQLACRHPGIGEPLRATLERIGRQFQRAVEEQHPDAAEIIEMGWHEQHDRA